MEYRGPKTAEERAIEDMEEQRVIELKLSTKQVGIVAWNRCIELGIPRLLMSNAVESCVRRMGGSGRKFNLPWKKLLLSFALYVPPILEPKLQEAAGCSQLR